MTDIVSWDDGQDLGVFNTQTEKAKNILSVQVGSLEYASELGIDISFFLSEDFKFQNESFKAYCIETLAQRGINVASITDTVNNLSRQYGFDLAPEQNGDGLLAR